MNEKMKSSAYCYETTNQDLVRCLFALSFLFFFFFLLSRIHKTLLLGMGGVRDFISYWVDPGSVRGKKDKQYQNERRLYISLINITRMNSAPYRHNYC